jgi:hypothetical protein
MTPNARTAAAIRAELNRPRASRKAQAPPDIAEIECRLRRLSAAAEQAKNDLVLIRRQNPTRDAELRTMVVTLDSVSGMTKQVAQRLAPMIEEGGA